MFHDIKELNRLAEEAKQKNLKPVGEAQENEAPPTDIYAEFREDSEEDFVEIDDVSVKITDEPSGHDASSIELQPEEDIELPKISPYDEPICVGGPTMAQVNLWKKEWANYRVMLVQIGDEYFVIRSLNRHEYKQIIALPNSNALQNEEIFCERCTLWPENYNWKKMASGKAGVPSTLASVIMENSGFTQDYGFQVL